MLTIIYTSIALEIWGSILSVAVLICMFIGKKTKERLNRIFIRILLCNLIVLLSDAASWGFKGRTDCFSFCVVRAANFLVYTFGYLLLAAFTDYIYHYIAAKAKISKKPVYAVWVICTAAVILVVISQFNNMYYLIDENNYYRRQDLFWVSQLLGMLCMFLNLYLLCRAGKYLRKKEMAYMLSYILLSVAAMGIQIFMHGLAILYIFITVTILIRYIGIEVEQVRLLHEKETELEMSRLNVMLSQIQPHFLFNTLTAIRALCDIDIARAEKAIEDFSRYLRNNLNSLSSMAPVPFEKELDHVGLYLSLEKMRFDDRLTVIYDIQVKEFLIPALTIQPLVENAVRHGVGKRENGGVISVSAKKTEQSIIITIQDNGVGFAAESDSEDGRSHVGIMNVRNRLMVQCGGTLEIKSTVGQGTTAVITLPRDGSVHQAPFIKKRE